MTDDVLLNDVAAIERAITRARTLVGDEPERLEDATIEEALLLDLLRACESSIDLAMQVVSKERLGLPQSSREVLELLERSGAIGADLRDRMQRRWDSATSTCTSTRASAGRSCSPSFAIAWATSRSCAEP